MPEKSLEARVAAIEAQLAGKALDTHFREQAELIDRRLAEGLREQAELIDRLFTYRFEESDKKRDKTLGVALTGLEERLDRKLESRLEPIYADLGALKDAVHAILARLP